MPSAKRILMKEKPAYILKQAFDVEAHRKNSLQQQSSMDQLSVTYDQGDASS